MDIGDYIYGSIDLACTQITGFIYPLPSSFLLFLCQLISILSPLCRRKIYFLLLFLDPSRAISPNTQPPLAKLAVHQPSLPFPKSVSWKRHLSHPHSLKIMSHSQLSNPDKSPSFHSHRAWKHCVVPYLPPGLYRSIHPSRLNPNKAMTREERDSSIISKWGWVLPSPVWLSFVSFSSDLTIGVWPSPRGGPKWDVRRGMGRRVG